MRSYQFALGDKEAMFDAIAKSYPSASRKEKDAKSRKILDKLLPKQTKVVSEQPINVGQTSNNYSMPMTAKEYDEEFGQDNAELEALITPESQPDEAIPDATTLPVELDGPDVELDKPDIDVSLDTPTMEQPLQLPESRPEEQPLPINNPELESPIIELDKPQINVSLGAPEVEQPLELPESRPEEQPLPIINPELEVESPKIDKPVIDVSLGKPEVEQPLELPESRPEEQPIPIHNPELKVDAPKLGMPILDTSITKPEIAKTASADKYSLTFNNEIGRGKYESRKLHTPPGNSGVTIGPGYDLSHRKAEEVVNDLTSVGIPKGDAEKIAQGVGLKGEKAKKFAKDNSEIRITDEQEKALFDKVIPEYQRRAKRDYNKLPVKGKPDYEKLPEEVKALLLDYSYNVGVSEFPSFFTALVSGNKKEAYKHYKRYTGKYELVQRNKDTLKLLNQYDFKDLSNRGN